MAKSSLALSNVYRLLEPGPVTLVTTTARGRTNVMTMSWHMMMEFDPPLVGCVISGRNWTFDLLRASRECVINIPTAEQAKQVVGCGNTSGRKVDKFTVFGLTPKASATVDAPRIDECYASLECRLADATMVDKYNMFVLEVVKAWKDRSVRRPGTLHHAGRGTFRIAGRTLELRSRAK
jgi:flavin reductase (DIM6/NTAB) family NADH-FMN oxidoreductase RutF